MNDTDAIIARRLLLAFCADDREAIKLLKVAGVNFFEVVLELAAVSEGGTSANVDESAGIRSVDDRRVSDMVNAPDCMNVDFYNVAIFNIWESVGVKVTTDSLVNRIVSSVGRLISGDEICQVVVHHKASIIVDANL